MMSMHRARGENRELQIVFKATLFAVSTIVPLIAIAAGVILSIFHFGMNSERSEALFALILASLLSVASNLFEAMYRPFGKYPKVIVLLATARMIEWVGSIAGAFIGGDLRSAAIGYLAGRALATISLYAFARHDVPEIEWKLAGVDLGRVRHLLRTGAGFISFTLGSLLTLQGMVVLVGTTLGGTAVAIFASSRTLARLVAQIAVLSGKAMSPEISAMYGANRHEEAERLSKHMIWIAMSITVLGALALEQFGPEIWRIWTRGKLVFDREIFSILLLAAISTAYWQIQSVRLTATNRHQVLASIFLVISVLSLIAAYLGLPRFRLGAAAAATLLPEMVMVIGSTVLLHRARVAVGRSDSHTGS